MKTDIVPYTAEEAQVLGKALVKLGCPTFGPAVGMDLLRVVEGIDIITKKRKLPSPLIEVLQSLRARLMDVVAIGGAMQMEVLTQLDDLIPDV